MNRSDDAAERAAGSAGSVLPRTEPIEVVPETGQDALIVFESMFGSTRRVAEAIADGLRTRATVAVRSVADLPAADGIRLLVIGAPTHAHSLSRASSRAEGREWAEDRARYALEPGAHDIGIREWLPVANIGDCAFAAFDTRADMPRLFTGSAAAVIARRLRRRGLRELLPPRSFLVDKDSRLLDGEIEQAYEWGRRLGGAFLVEGATPGERRS